MSPLSSPENADAPFEDPDFVMSEEVQTEYKRGVAEGQKRIRYLCVEAFRRALADELEIDALKARIEDLKGRSGIPAQQRRDPSLAGAGAKGALDWAVSRWNAEVKNRPLVNVHRRSLDTTWRQVIRYLGGDDEGLCGPPHDELVSAFTSPECPSPVEPFLDGHPLVTELLCEVDRAVKQSGGTGIYDTVIRHILNKHLLGVGPLASQPQLDEMPVRLGETISIDEMINRLERRGAELNGFAITPNGQLMLKAAFYIKRLASHVSAVTIQPQEMRSLHDYTDAEIANEHHARAMRFLGDQAVGVTMPTVPMCSCKASARDGQHMAWCPAITRPELCPTEKTDGSQS